jgi:sulfhydrogenase subunit beta (sulfur reductase)
VLRVGDAVIIDRSGLDRLIAGLAEKGYRTSGPAVREGAIALTEIRSSGDLPEGWHDTQAPGRYRLQKGEDPALFGWAVGPSSVKRDVFPSRSVLWRATVTDRGVSFDEAADDPPPTALVGVRPCEIAALEVLDRVLGESRVPDPSYQGRRAGFVVAAECTAPSGTCFCASMTTGPAAREGFDLALLELIDDGGHRFLVRVGSDQGAKVMAKVPFRPAGDADLRARLAALESATQHMGRQLDTDDLPGLLARNLDHPRWDEVAERCLACGNCTLVCPTCFCATVQDTTDLDGAVTRERSWASCFDLDHSFLHGGAVRESTRSRYRQWMTHKLSTWWDQFGMSGCVGCGRCITWCPVGIDLTEEAAAIRSSPNEATRV